MTPMRSCSPPRPAGRTLPDLAGLAEEMRRRATAADPGGPGRDAGFDERRVRLGVTFGGAGVLEGELTPACAAALQAVLEALGKKAGPEDVRTAPQRRHDALEEACRRLIGAGCLPDRAGQPTHIQLHLTLDQLRDLPGATDAEADWAAAHAAQTARAAAEGQPGWLTGRATQGYACDAAIAPIVTGRWTRPRWPRWPPNSWPGSGTAAPVTAGPPLGGCRTADRSRPGMAAGPTARTAIWSADNAAGPAGTQPTAIAVTPVRLATRRRRCIQPCWPGCTTPCCGTPPPSCPARTGWPRSCAPASPAIRFPSVSLPLDAGTQANMVTPCLRRAILGPRPALRLPGCQHPPPAACQIHHIRPKSKGGKTKLTNLILLCAFHHLIAVHQWGWALTLNADGTITAVSPDRSRTLHSPDHPAAPPERGPQQRPGCTRRCFT